MSWPTPQEYNEAIQNPHYNFADDELRCGIADSDSLGLPRVTSGSFASVYKIKCQSRDLAVRCFLRDTPDQQERYVRISEYLSAVRMPHTVSFNYLEDGIRVSGSWFPVLKMEWIDGEPLDFYVRKNISDRRVLLDLAAQFKQMVCDLGKAGIAHGDLQHGNILVSAEGKCHLVDYDGMFVPTLEGCYAHEIGHRNYQHPARDHLHFDDRLDNFSAWSIYTSLMCLAEDPQLLKRVGGCDECLLFRQIDYRYPLRSMTFFTLEAHDSPVIRNMARALRSLLDRPMADIPGLNERVEPPENLPVMSNVFSALPSFGGAWPGQAHAVTSEEEASQWAFYPRLNDYMHAITSPAKAFFDEELRQSILALDHGNLRALAGERGAVFRFHTRNNRDVAVKVFFHPDEQRAERYHLLSQFLRAERSELGRLRKYLVDFEYQHNGIKINNATYPIVKMDWIDGPTLFEAVENSKQQRENIANYAHKFKEMMVALRRGGIVHGDIDAENIIVSSNGFRLVDYDLMRTPLTVNVQPAVLDDFATMSNRHYRHPKVKNAERALNDNFPAWVLYTSLCVLAVQPELWNQAGVKPGRLLFHQKDFANPASSFVFALLEDHYSHVVRSLTAQLKMMAFWDPEHVPMLFDEPQKELAPKALERKPLSEHEMQILTFGTLASQQQAANNGTGWGVIAVVAACTVWGLMSHAFIPACLVIGVLAVAAWAVSKKI